MSSRMRRVNNMSRFLHLATRVDRAVYEQQAARLMTRVRLKVLNVLHWKHPGQPVARRARAVGFAAEHRWLRR